MLSVKEKLITIIKHIRWIYDIYYYGCNFLVKMMGIFVKKEDNLILITSFGGKKYDDSPKVLYEKMIRDSRFDGYNIIWAFHNPEQFAHLKLNTIKVDTISYFKTALKARCWITNSGIERGLNFKPKSTFYFNTWHGTPIKKMGSDLSKKNESFKGKGRNTVDIMTAQSDFEADVFSRVFGIPANNFLKCGLPRNDKLANYTHEHYKLIKEKLELPKDKKVILYAPTFREYERDAEHNCILKPPMNLDKWQERLGDEYCLLFRAHYEVAKVMNMQDNVFVKNMSSYESLEDLMIVSDILISDYSSIFFDFSIMDKVMLHFTYDYDKYKEKRGMYFDIREYLPGGKNEDEIIELLRKLTDIEKDATRKFREKYINYYGNAADQSLDCIAAHIGGKR